MDKIYLAEDNQANRYHLTKILTAAGYAVDAIKNGQELSDAYHVSKPDLIITDLKMPVMDGFELIEHIRESTEFSHIPIIIISDNFQDIQSKIQGFDIGANDFLTPPIDEDELLLKVKSMLKTKHMHAELIQTRAQLRKSEELFRRTLSGTPITIAYCDTDLRYKWVFNPHPDFGNQSIINKRDDEVSQNEGSLELTAIKQKVIDTGETIHAEIDFPLSNGTVSYSVVARPYHDDHDRIIGLTTASFDITRRKQIENERNTILYELELVNRVILKINLESSIDVMAEILAKAVYEVNPGCHVAVSLYDETIGGVQIKSVIGLDENQEKIIKALGKDPRKIKFDQQILDKVYTNYTTGKLVLVKGGLAELMAGHVPKIQCMMAEKLMGLEAVYTAGFASAEMAKGGVVILMKKGQKIKHPSAIETLVAQTSQVIQKKQYEEQFKKKTDIIRERTASLARSVRDVEDRNRQMRQEITERRQAEEALKAKSLFLESLIQQSPLPTFVMDSKGFNVMVNEAFLKFYAVPDKDMVLGRNALTDPANLSQGVVKYFKEAFKGEIVETPDIEFVSPHENKKVITRCKMFPILDPTGTLTNVVVMQEDITERKQAEKALKESEDRYRQIYQFSPNLMIIHDMDMNILDVNDKTVEEFGYSKEELLEKKISELHPETELEHSAQVFGAMKNTNQLTIETKFVRKDGSVFLAEETPCKYTLENDSIIHVAIRDITEQKQAEETLRENHARHAAMIANSSDVIVIMGADGITKYQSPNIERWFGWKPEVLIGTNGLEKVHPGDIERIQQEFINVLKEEIASTHEFRLRCKDDKYKWVEFTAINRINDPEINGVLLNYHDITEQKHAEAALKESETNYRNIVHDQTEYIMRYLPDGTRTFVNDSYCNAFNISREEAAGTSFLQGVSKAAKARLKNKIATLTPENQVISDEHESKSIDGNKVWRLWVDRGIFDEKGILKEIQATGRDITKRKLAEIDRELALQEAHAASEVKDQFMANISHEIRTPLNSILGFSDLLRTRFGDLLSEKDQELFGYIANSSTRLMSTVDSILNISQLKAGVIQVHPIEIDLSLMTAQVVKQIKLQALDKKLDLIFKVPKKPKLIFADEYCIHQSILNLIENAIKYTIKGTVEIKLGHRADQLTLSITDTGIGISDQFKERIFEPYSQESEGFTKIYQGVGLGLALTKRYLGLNDVALELVSQKNVGSTFTLIFPKYERGS